MMNLPPASTISVPAGSAGAPVSPDQTRAILPSVMRIWALAIGAPPVPSIKVPPRTSRLAPFACVKAKSSRHSEKLRWPIRRIRRRMSDNLDIFNSNKTCGGDGERLRAQKHLQLRQRLFGRLLGKEMPSGEGLAGHFHAGACLPGGDAVEDPPRVSLRGPERQY